MTSKFRQPRITKGTLKAQWGYSKDDGEDIFTTWGDGCKKMDANLLMSILSSKRMVSALGDDLPYRFMDSFVEELEKRGYDLTTLKFSIKKKEE